jgi:type I restriction enzyme S subunit
MKTTAVQPLRFMDKENKRLPPAHDPRTKLELAAGDLLITRAGPRSRVGVACLVKTTRPHLMLCDKAYRLRVKLDVAMAGFLEIVLNSPDMLDALDELKTGISDSGLNLTQKRFKELLVPLPPLVEQSRVVAEVERNLSLADEAEVQVNANLQRADRLRQSILMRAFTGGICVGEPSCGPLAVASRMIALTRNVVHCLSAARSCVA